MSARRYRLAAGVTAGALLAGVWALARWAGAPSWAALIGAAFLAGVALRLVVEAPALVPGARARARAAGRRLLELAVNR